MAPLRCMASEILDEETLRSRETISSSRLILGAVLAWATSIDSRIFRADSVTFALRTMLPPTMTMAAPLATASAAEAASIPPAAATGVFTSLTICLRKSMVSLPVICWSIPT